MVKTSLDEFNIEIGEKLRSVSAIERYILVHYLGLLLAV